MAVNSKKAVLAVYEVLKKYSSWNNPLSLAKIRELVESKYGLTANRGTISDTVNEIRDFYGEDVFSCSESERERDGVKTDYKYAFFYDRDNAEDALSDEEIAKLVDLCMYARSMSDKEAKGLIRSLKGLATVHEHKRFDEYTEDIPEKQFNINPKTSDNLRKLHEMIAKNRGRNQHWVRFDFNYYSSAQERHLSFDRSYEVLPLRICEANHKYYLLCAMEGSVEKIYHFRIDLMTHIRDLKHDNVRGMEELKKKLSTKDISEYMSSHLYMFYGEPCSIDLRIPKDGETANLTFLVDAFGANTRWRVVEETDEAVVVRLQCVPAAMKILIMQYASLGLQVVGPGKVKAEIDKMIKEDCEKLLATLP